MRTFATLALACLLSLPAMAHEYTVGNLKIIHPYSRAMPPASPAAAVFFSIVNKGQQADRLLAITTPQAPRAELHKHSNDNGVMRMRPLEGGVAIAAGETVKLAPGGVHVMLLDLKQQAKAGDHFPLTLKFEKAGEVKVDVKVEDGADLPMQHGDMPMKN
ncbi:copper chaperone PCu(A)C [Vogesella sp. LIG4]|uniref:copper chaperone PCu(A)C n=1 Tax=Vogesella sp. LIG4 TaxID=1192162 RepID=UPI00081FE851|nr:copper chaperone PCu(A)C [Vogesella sp. LIG4]SCK11041.1 hypothetical protein PSELUDRAFT_0894 [Vogesella sp. LIG4]